MDSSRKAHGPRWISHLLVPWCLDLEVGNQHDRQGRTTGSIGRRDGRARDNEHGKVALTGTLAAICPHTPTVIHPRFFELGNLVFHVKCLIMRVTYHFLGILPRPQQARGFLQAQENIHVLHSAACLALYPVVDQAHHNHLPCPLIHILSFQVFHTLNPKIYDVSILYDIIFTP